jgi:hypothetical protein
VIVKAATRLTECNARQCLFHLWIRLCLHQSYSNSWQHSNATVCVPVRTSAFQSCFDGWYSKIITLILVKFLHICWCRFECSLGRQELTVSSVMRYDSHRKVARPADLTNFVVLFALICQITSHLHYFPCSSLHADQIYEFIIKRVNSTSNPQLYAL